LHFALELVYVLDQGQISNFFQGMIVFDQA
jgi:hypothetical protein